MDTRADRIEKAHIPLILVILSNSGLTVYSSRDYYRDTDHYCTDDDAERRIVVLFDLMMDIKDPAQDEISDREKDEADDHKDQRRDQYLRELIKPDYKCRYCWRDEIHQHLLSSAKTRIDKWNSQP
jgi:hypothetical protein